MVDFGDAAIHEAIEKVKSTPDYFVWLTHVPRSDTKLKVNSNIKTISPTNDSLLICFSFSPPNKTGA
jgi:hypothetical protein